MRAQRRGFTLVEVIITIIIGAILTSMALNAFSNTRRSLAVSGAKSTFEAMLARTRAQAIELGTTLRLRVDLTNDRVGIMNGTTLLEALDFRSEMGVDLDATPDSISICMSPRGYADSDCNSFSSTVDLRFVSGGAADTVQILPLGFLR